MAKQNVLQEGDERLESIESTLSKTEEWIEKNRRAISIVVIAIIAVVLVVLGIKKFYLDPREQEAQRSIFRAEQYFENDDFTNALNGDGNNAGFLDIINDYGCTKTSNLAKYYAGVCYLNLGNFDDAIKYLGQYKGKDLFVSTLAVGGMGDAYMELGNTAKAAELYVKAARTAKNKVTSPMYLVRAGMAYEMSGDYKSAISAYKEVKADYPTSNEAFYIQKNISRAEKGL